MKRELTIGNCIFRNTRGIASVIIDLKNVDDKKAFTLVGRIYDPVKETDVCYGQCLEDLIDLFPTNKKMKHLYKLHCNWNNNYDPITGEYTELPNSVAGDIENIIINW